ncbi:class GN sortase [uncultured Cohaesibacter sp.]|uniref:class GN sortase n=1 Tax=uncultured Cohaesibacter sp. TaxID=1002546 RepID=UPI0029C64E77|nr:class GN sortase [uncultured Cohaesibacter sp.]
MQPVKATTTTPTARKVLYGLSLLSGLAGFACLAVGLWIPAKAELAQYLLERAWEKSRISGEPIKAWPWADSWPVARLTIPSLDFEAIILHEAGGEGLAFGPVFLSQSAPIGSTGTSVISAHRDTHFKALADLKPGAFVTVETLAGDKDTYQIDSLRKARWDQSGLTREALEPRLALTTCWPFGSLTPGPMRFIAEAHLSEQTAAFNESAEVLPQ